MTRIISTNIKDAEVIHFDGRDVYWLQKVQENCPNFSSVCTCIYKPGARAKPAHAHLRGEETIYVMSGSGKVKVDAINKYDSDHGIIISNTTLNIEKKDNIIYIYTL